MAQRLGDGQSRVISVCGREADIGQSQGCKISHGQRFVVRAAQNRRLEGITGRLFERPKTLTQAGSHMLNVVQKGGARQVQMFVSYSPAQIKHPDGAGRLLPVTLS